MVIVNIFERGFGPKHPDHCKPHRATGFTICFGLPTTKESKQMPVEVSLTVEEKVTATLKPVTKTGKPAKLDGVPVWSVVSGDATVVPAADGLSADLVSSDTPGDTVFLVDGDADLGAGVVDIQDTITLHSLGANAANLGITVSDPVPK
jgi:hypothetical protein